MNRKILVMHYFYEFLVILVVISAVICPIWLIIEIVKQNLRKKEERSYGLKVAILSIISLIDFILIGTVIVIFNSGPACPSC